ncbi:hypothetical protein [Kutzneria sp. 744]|uniref:hypothetical protein n=1 Tax=Kutzneria sp. (strain 744) TaxID=345341 RepID=UPI0003EEBFE4|nr:hypothetical protein [Kutzneria sp. 744]EWM12050.1 hypothetical protein KUTG_02354 [Kutzneria sp. 744]
MDPLSLSALGATGLGYTVKFLFDRASAALDRRAQRRTAAETGSSNDSISEAATDLAAPEGAHKPAAGVETVDKDAAEREVIGAMGVLEVYRAKNLALEPGDKVLLDTVQRLHAALERLEGVPVDLGAAVKSLIEVDQAADHVRGVMTGADLGAVPLDSTTSVKQRIGTVHEGGSVTGFRAGGVQ